MIAVLSASFLKAALLRSSPSTRVSVPRLSVTVILVGCATTAFASLVAPSGESTPLVAAGQVQSQPTQNISFAVTSDTYTQGAGAGFTKIGDQETIYLKTTNNGTLTTESTQT